MPVTPEAFYTVDEAAQRLRMHPDTLRRQLRQGRIRSVRSGKLWRIPASALEAPELANQTVTPTSAEAKIFDALFAPPTPAQIAARLQAWQNFGQSTAPGHGSNLTDDAVAQSYAERADELMDGLR